ncbi:hypothetical protein [Actinokineospora iranica]|uniref:Uncharacterized protein n=1 Tax=Actinokineospora iranica TaxID=1271860 RepID=A0A1G6U9B3_9PSEU|nr:hypothetical protein [Actinokineospora iranica]SDD37177.1 hypothetical protein SAMN05216174_110142 [Actinokineospora iranica]
MSHTVVSLVDAAPHCPELRELLAVRQDGWRFHLLSQDDVVFGVAVSRGEAGHTDVVFAFAQGPVLGLRVVSVEDGIVWMAHGESLAEVARELIAVPAPGRCGAPDLILPVSALSATGDVA